ncbi:ribonuclease III domain-containing protein [Nemania abortiva]|nr:ribonuclease III domain-containing protein [Nemania abortiva]
MAQKIINYQFQNEDLLWEALQAPGSGVVTLNGRVLAQGNKNLAAIGDAVATLIIKSHCYEMDRSIGHTTLYLATLVGNARLASLCNEAGLTDCINRNPSLDGVEARTRADTIEAIIGAVYRDGGINSAESVMRSLRVIDYAEV